MKYREFMSLTDEEITFIIKDIFPTTLKVDNIRKDTKWETIYCDIYIVEECPDYADTLTLTADSPEPITTSDFALTNEELWQWKQYLLAKGCDERLKDNPYLEQKESDSLSKSGEYIHKQTLLDSMDQRYNEKVDIVPNNLAEGFMQMEKLIKEQPTVQINTWISVNDRLPEKAGSYLVVGKTGGARVTRWYEPNKYFPSGHFGGNGAEYIQYWMPRPDTPFKR